MREVNIVPVDEQLINQIRFHINRIEKQNILIQDRDMWLLLCSSLDAIEDSMWAIGYYIDSDYPEDLRGKYLFTYGLLQAIFLQQDAVNHINVSLFDEKIEFKRDYPDLYKFREIRNDVVGHPTLRNKNNRDFYIHLSQHSMSKYGFEYMIYGQDTEFVSVDLEARLNFHMQSINTILAKVVNRLDDEFKEYIKMHKGTKLSDIFKGLSYRREKLLVPSAFNFELKIPFLKSIKEMVEQCKLELNKRFVSWEEVDCYHYVIGEIDELLDLVLGESLPKEIPQIEKYLLQHLFCKLEELVACCEETDAYFENDGMEAQPDTECMPVVIIDDIEIC